MYPSIAVNENYLQFFGLLAFERKDRHSSRGLLGCDAVYCSGTTHNTTRRHNPEDLDVKHYRRESLKIRKDGHSIISLSSNFPLITSEPTKEFS
jgi:hypothetical protein